MARRKTEFASRIKALREAAGMNQAQLAAALGVTHPLVSQSEGGKKTPSTDLLVRLGSVAAEKRRYDDAKWFWEQAGMNTAALDNLVDIRVQERAASPEEFIAVSALDPSEKETVAFPARMLASPASTRFVRLRTSGDSFSIGDIKYNPPLWPSSADVLLIDPGETDLRRMDKGSFVAVRIKSRDGKHYHDYAGILMKFFAGDHTEYRLRMPDESVFLGISLEGARGPVTLRGMDSTVLGLVVAWIGPKE